MTNAVQDIAVTDTIEEIVDLKPLPATVEELEKEGYAIPDDPKILCFVNAFLTDPECDKKALAEKCEVSRQTIYNWVEKLQKREPLGTKGKRKKYGDEQSVPIAIRISETLYGELEEMAANEGITLRQYIEDRIPYWVSGDQNLSTMFESKSSGN